jgi:ABC-type multidrug transport system fused ATPase/permease subunit
VIGVCHLSGEKEVQREMVFLARFLYGNLKGYRLLVVGAFAATILEVIVAGQVAFVTKFIIDKATPPHTDPGGIYTAILNLFKPVAAGQSHEIFTTITFLLITLVVLGLLDSLFTYAQQFLASYIAQHLTARLRQKLFDHLQRLSLDWHGKQKKGDLVQRVTGDIANVEKLITDGLVDLLGSVFTVLNAIVLMLAAQVQLTVISIVMVPALFFIIFTYTRAIKAAAKRASKSVGQVADVATEDVGAITVLKAFSLEDREALRFNRYVGKSRQAGLEAGGLQAQFTPVVNLLITVGTAVILGEGCFALATGTFPIVNIQANPPVTAGTLVLFLSLLKQLYQPMKDLSKLTNVATAAAAGAERMQEVLDQAPEVTESVAPYHGPQRFQGDIRFEQVIFGYNAERPVLKGIDLHIPAGKKVALVGLSGGGKTTLVKLIPRFYETQQGAVKIDGIDNRIIPLDVLRRNVTQVLQESVLFEGTILDNIKIGRPDATMEQVFEAARQAQIHETIMSLPDGYDTTVRERGKNFSGGQRQRLAIARAILCDSPILVLDEPTAALDVEAEAEVLRVIDKLVVGRTVLMISHRLSTLGKVDEIIVLKDGVIAEQGNYQDLKVRNGIFAGLLKEQNRYNVDYSGESMIVPKGEVQRMLGVRSQGLGAQPPSAPISSLATRPEVAVAGNSYHTVVANGGGSPSGRLLIEVDGKVVGQKPLDKPVLTIGRLPANDVHVPSQRVSRLHAKIRWDAMERGWLIEDAESLNGLVYHGQRVDQHIMQRGDRIYLAPTAVVQFEPA